MKRLILTLTGSKKVIQAARSPQFTCVVICHTSPLKGKIPNLIRSISLAGAQLPACWLDNKNLHRLLKLGKMTNPVLPKRISLILLWAEFPQIDPIQIVNPLPNTVYIFGRQWGAQSYLASLKNNKELDNFRNWPPILVLTCWQYDEKLIVFRKNN